MPQTQSPTIPPDDLRRAATLAASDGPGRPHVAVAGDTYTILLSGPETAGRFCLIDMHVPPGGGPPPHRHDFEETFTLLEGELAFNCRGTRSTVRAGQTIHIPANAPHVFTNAGDRPARMFCTCSPAGQEELFLAVGDPVPDRTSPPPHLSDAEQAERKAKAMALAPKYKTEFVPM